MHSRPAFTTANERLSQPLTNVGDSRGTVEVFQGYLEVCKFNGHNLAGTSSNGMTPDFGFGPSCEGADVFVLTCAA